MGIRQTYDKRVIIKLTEDDRVLFDQASRSAGLSLSAWIRYVVRRASFEQIGARVVPRGTESADGN